MNVDVDGAAGGESVQSKGAIPKAESPEKSFEAFFERTYPPLVRGAFLVCRSREEAEDVAQEALARVYERWGRVREMDSPDGYAFRIALDLARRRRGWGLLPLRHEAAARESSDERTVEHIDVVRAVRALRPIYQEVVVLHEWLGLGAAECARVLRISPVSVRVRLHRARTQLRERLGGDYA